jgi:hypothetical protein
MTQRSRLLFTALIPCALWLAVTCAPPPLDERGKLCNAERPCGPDYVCVQERCAALADLADGGLDGGTGGTDGGTGGTDGGSDGGTDGGFVVCPTGGPNLLVNGDFEQPAVSPQGPGTTPTGWTATAPAQVLLDAQTFRCGQQSARVTSTVVDGAVELAPSSAPVQPSGTSLYCASAWLRGTADAGYQMRLEIREYEQDGQLRDFGASPYVVPNGVWTNVQASYRATGRESLSLRAYAPRSPAGAVMHVDGAALWRSTNGGCQP